MPKFAKGHNSRKIWQNLFKVNQVIYSSASISWPSFKLLAEILFEKCPNLAKGHNSENIWRNLFKSKSVNLLILPNQLTKFQAPSSNSFRDILLTNVKCPNLQRAITPNKFVRIFYKVNQVIYSSPPISWPSFKALAQVVFEISCWQV